MSTETSIEVGDRVRNAHGGEGTVTCVHSGGLVSWWSDRFGCVAQSWLADLRLVAKASYTDVTEHPAVTEMRGAWKDAYGEPLENAVAMGVPLSRLARAVLAVIDLVGEQQAELERRSELPTDEAPSWEAGYAIGQRHEREKQEAEALQLRNRLEFVVADQEQLIEAQERDVAELAAWRSATGCDTPEGAKALLGSLLQRDAVAVRAEVEVARLRRELDEARAATVKPPETDDGEVMTARWQRERAETAEAEATRLRAELDEALDLAEDSGEWKRAAEAARDAAARLRAELDEARARLGCWRYGLLRRDDDAIARAEAAEAASSRLVEAMEKAATVAFKGPHDTDAGCLLRAARNLDGGFDVGGSNVRAAAARVLRVVADVLRDAERAGGEK